MRGTSWQDWDPPAPLHVPYKERLPDGFIRNKLLSKPVAKDGVIHRDPDPGSLSTRGNRFLSTWDSPDHKDAAPVKIASMTMAVTGPTAPQADAPIEEWVRFYRWLGLNVIPAPTGTKKPAIHWTEFQERKATDEEIDSWLHDGSFQNIAVLCGESSGYLTVIDFDEMDAYKQSFDPKIEDETLVVRTGSGRGVHVYLRGDKSVATVSYEHQKPKFSIRGQGSIAILPPSVHPTGQRYEIISRTIEPMEIEQIEESLAQLLSRLGVKDKKPLSMKEVVKGVSEGGRELNMFRLAWFLLKVVKLAEADALTQLQERNASNEPPLPEEELKHAFDCAKKARRPKDLDKIEKTEFDVEDELQPTPEERDLANKILQSPKALQIIKILLDEGIRREGRNKIYAFLIILTAKHPNRALKQILVLGGMPGGGKTTIANLLAKLVRTKKVGRFSEHAMDYSKLENYEMLYIQELLDLEQQKKMGVSSVRFLSSDDQGYTIEITKGDPDGGFTTEQKKIPAMTVISTTTVTDTEAQFERRIHRMNVDESKETTKAVLDWKAQEKKRGVLEWLGEVKPRRGIYILKAIVDLLQPYDVTTAAVSESLSHVLKTDFVRARGDYNKLLALTEMIAWLHQQRRPYVTRIVDGHEERMILALPQDAYYALEIGLQPILTMMTQMDKRLRDLLPAIAGMKDSEYKSKKMDEPLHGFTITQLLPKARETVKKPDLTRDTLHNWLKVLVDKGILAVTKPSSENVYSIISSFETKETHSLLGDDQSPSMIAAELQKEAESFFSSVLDGLPERLTSLTPEDWFDSDELDRDLTPLIEQQTTEPEAGFKVALKARKNAPQQDLGGLEFDKSSGPAAKGGDA